MGPSERARVRVVVVGGSGFGRECLDVLEAMRASGTDLEVVGIVDDALSPADRDRLARRGVAHLGSVADLVAAGDTTLAYVLGVDHPLTRVVLVERLDAAGFLPFSAIHPRAVIGSDSSIGPGAVICAGVVIATNARIGRHVHLDPQVTIGRDAVLADFVSVHPGAIVSDDVTVGAATLVGASATILRGLLVREDVVVGAGAVVTRDVPADATVVGVPGTWA